MYSVERLFTCLLYTSHCSGDAGCSTECRYIEKAQASGCCQKRAGELEKLICKIYEDNALGKLPDARYRALDAQSVSYTHLDVYKRQAVDYAANRDKTESACFETGLGCTTTSAFEDMRLNTLRWLSLIHI